MARWISLKKAACKYGVSEKDVQTWAKLKEIASVRTKETFVVDDVSIKKFLSRHQTLPTGEYILLLELLTENQKVIIESYMEISNTQQEELEQQKETIDRMKKTINLLEKQNQQIKEILRQ